MPQDSLNAPGACGHDFVPTITVVGRGSVRVPPDRVVFTFEIEALTPSVDETQRSLGERRKRLARALEMAGVPADAARSTGPQLRPRHDYEKSRWIFKGIYGNEHIVVRLPAETDAWAARVLRAIGVELEHVRVNVGHALRDDRAARAEALRAAVADARGKAETIASASAVELGPVRELRHEPEMDSIVAASGTVAERGEEDTEFGIADVRVTAEVKVVWALGASHLKSQI